MNYNNLDDKTKGMIKIGVTLIVIAVLLLLISFIYSLFGGSKLSYDKIENQMIRGTKKYLEAHPEKKGALDFSTIKIKVSDLIAEGYMKELSKYTKEGVSCTGNVLVHKNLDNLSYTPKLDCGKDYKYKNLVDEITKPENIVTADAGLYKVETANPYYLYRGEDVNNYVMIGEKLWRILRIESDNTIRIIEDDTKNRSEWDNRYNQDKEYDCGINEFTYTEPSRIKEKLTSILEEEKEIFTSELKSIIVPKELCIGKRSTIEIDNTGAVECSKKSELMQVGIPYLSEYFLASLDTSCFGLNSLTCSNYNYLAKTYKKIMTLTASADNSYDVYSITKLPKITRASNTSYIFLVINLSKDINYTSGVGTLENPYIIDIKA